MKFPLPWKIIIFFLLCLLTLVAHLTVERYHEVGEQLLQNNHFTEGLEEWVVKAAEAGMVSTEQGQVQLYSTDGRRSAQLSQSIKTPLPGRRVGLRAWVKTENIAAGPQKWNTGRVILLQYQQEKPQYKAPHVLASLKGTNDWAEYRATFPILPGTSELRVVLQLSRCTGELYCRDMSLFLLQPNLLFGVVQWSIMGGWVLFAMVLFGPVFFGACRGWLTPALTVLAIIGIIVGTTLPGSLKNELREELIQEAKAYSQTLAGADGIHSAKDMAGKLGIDTSALDISKFAHFGLFGLLTFLLLWQRKQPKPLLILVDVLMLACATELLQLFVEGRGALPLDVVIDMAGGATGMLGWGIVKRPT